MLAPRDMDRKPVVGRSMRITASIEDNAMRVPSFAFATRALLVAVPATLVTGCMTASAAQPADAPPPTEQTCHAEPAKALVGQRFDAAALRRASGAGEVRKVNPGEAISMLFMNGRLTVYVDAQGTITALSCS